MRENRSKIKPIFITCPSGAKQGKRPNSREQQTHKQPNTQTTNQQKASAGKACFGIGHGSSEHQGKEERKHVTSMSTDYFSDWKRFAGAAAEKKGHVPYVRLTRPLLFVLVLAALVSRTTWVQCFRTKRQVCFIDGAFSGVVCGVCTCVYVRWSLVFVLLF